MNLRFWLRGNLLRRKLRLLRQRALAELLSALRLPSLLPRSPLADVNDPAAESRLTVPHFGETDLDLRVFSSDTVRLDMSYKQWIDPLLNLPPGSTLNDLKQAAEKLPGYNSQVQYFFPTTPYVKAIELTAKFRASWAHRVRATRTADTGLNKDEPAILLVYAAARVKENQETLIERG